MHSQASALPSIIVVGNGMVGHKFVEKMVAKGGHERYRITVIGEETMHAYDRVHLTSYFSGKSADDLQLTPRTWYEQNGITHVTGEKVVLIDREQRCVRTSQDRVLFYDHLVMATGSAPLVPAIAGVDKNGVFVYRTIDDLKAIEAFSKQARCAAVIGGGLLGLEAAKALVDLGLQTHVIEFADRLMPRQIDNAGSRFLENEIKKLGVQIHLSKSTQAILGNGHVQGMAFNDASTLEVDMVVVSAGIRPRDELARACGLEVGQRGGIAVNDRLQSSDPGIYAIGEVALHQNMIYGLVAPGYAMAEVLARNFMGEEQSFRGADLSTKLKLLGVEVANIGSTASDDASCLPIIYQDHQKGVYQKLFISSDGRQLKGAILVGDASPYHQLYQIYAGQTPMPAAVDSLLWGGKTASTTQSGSQNMADHAQVCVCENVSKGVICSAIREQKLDKISQIKSSTKAGTGCGGCVPLLNELLQAELKAQGQAVKKTICEHFLFSRHELFEIVKVKKIKSFEALLQSHGRGQGCEVCKPAVASILAGIWNEWIIDHQNIQDTNDRYLANIQRGGTYSIIPRVPGGEITPDKLIALGAIAKQYDLYCKITGGQRIDLLGARVEQLPSIWEALVEAGFESGHAYGKAMRTVKSCIGTTWCRYGVQDSTSFAIRIEERYRGIRAPHKLKAAASGCMRECAEAQCKDFGVVATEKGWNLFVCGNGGAKPQHAQLLATDIDEDTCIKYLDRFLMYYIQTADPLTRTAPWLNKLEGGMDHIKAVVIADELGICAQLEKDMAYLVDGYQCEWKMVVEDPEKRRLFTHFINSSEADPALQFVEERGQKRPADWADHSESQTQLSVGPLAWYAVAPVIAFPENAGVAVKYGNTQIAVFNFNHRQNWYASQNMCPHRKDMTLARGLLGSHGEDPKVACPLHKKTFSLTHGGCLSGEDYRIQTFPVKVENQHVYVQLPSVEVLEEKTCEKSLACP